MIASASNNSKTEVSEFPLQPMNITILKVEGDDDGDGYPGLEPGEEIGMIYYQQEVSVEDFCHYKNYPTLFQIEENKLELKENGTGLKNDTSGIKWKIWPPYIKEDEEK